MLRVFTLLYDLLFTLSLYVLSNMGRFEVESEYQGVYEINMPLDQEICSIMLYIEDCIEGK